VTLPRSWAGTAWNPVPHSENRIHSDAVAARFGFRGALVPGVVVSAYLLQPAVEAWGAGWLARGGAKVVVERPVYDGERFEVGVSDARADGYAAELRGAAEGDLRARATVDLPDAAPEPPAMRGDPRIGRDHERAPATREAMERLRVEGLGAVRARWPEAEFTSYAKDPADVPRLLRLDGGEGFANPAFVLGMTNWALAANVRMDPWIHLQTEHRNFAPIPPGSELVVEQRIADLFERKGHEFVDVDLAAFHTDGRPVMSARLRAIYRLRGT
jgi:acyl dehydratase